MFFLFEICIKVKYCNKIFSNITILINYFNAIQEIINFIIIVSYCVSYFPMTPLGFVFFTPDSLKNIITLVSAHHGDFCCILCLSSDLPVSLGACCSFSPAYNWIWVWDRGPLGSEIKEGRLSLRSRWGRNISFIHFLTDSQVQSVTFFSAIQSKYELFSKSTLYVSGRDSGFAFLLL